MLDKEPGLGDGTEPVLVEAVITEGAIEAFHEGVLHGLTGLPVPFFLWPRTEGRM